MFSEKLIKKGKKWLRDYERVSDPMDIDPDAYEGSAYYIIASLVSEGEEINDVLKGKNI